jgi:DNA repair protein RecO (recombination protein O)
MDERATGIVLRTHPLTETSLIVHWLTDCQGRVATVAKGALRPKSPFRGKLDLFYVCDLSFARSRRSELHTLREVVLRDTHAPLRRELGWLRQAAYASALIEQTTETGTPLQAFFILLRDLLQALPRHPPQPLTLFGFEIKLLDELGLSPDLASTRLSPGARQILQKCRTTSPSDLFVLKLSPAQDLELRQFLHGFLLYHAGRVPAGRAAALSDPAAAGTRSHS